MTFLPQTLPLVLLSLLLASPAMGEEEEEEEEEPTPLDEGSKALAPLLPQGEKPLSAAPPWAMTEASCIDQLGVLPDLRSRSKQLDGREQALAARETAVERLEIRAGEQITHLESIRAEILEAMATQVARRDSRVEELAKMMGSMKAKKAAPMLATLDENTAIGVLEALDSKQAGKILAAMPAAEARRLGERYTKLLDPRSQDNSPTNAEDK
jgi:flagellar motility protein MotE (MotC chaperone)